MQGIDLSGIADTVGSILNPAASFAEDLVEGLTGDSLLADVVSLGINIATGNYPAAIADAVEIVGDVAERFEPPALPPPGEGYQEEMPGYWDNEVPPPGNYFDDMGPIEDPRERLQDTPQERICGGTTPQQRFSSILNDPTLSLEEKMALVFAEIQDELDGQIEAKMEDIAQADGDASTRLTQELQLLVQKRERMTTLATNLSRMMNDMSMRVLQNI